MLSSSLSVKIGDKWLALIAVNEFELILAQWTMNNFIRCGSFERLHKQNRFFI